MTNIDDAPSSAESLPAFAKEWMTQWRSAAQELPKLRDRELRGMTDQQAINAAIALDPARPYPVRDESGMVIMQQLFGKLRKATTP